MVNLRLEQVKIVVIRKTFSWEPVPQGIGSREEAAQVKPNFLLIEYGKNVGDSLQCAWNRRSKLSRL